MRPNRAALLALAFLVSSLPGSRVLAAAEEPAPPDLPAGVWQMRSLSWLESWSGGEEFEAVQFVPRFDDPAQSVGFAVLEGGAGEPSLLETTDEGKTWILVNRTLSFTGGVRFFNDRIGVGYGKRDDPGPDQTDPIGVWRTVDGGRTWYLASVSEKVSPFFDPDNAANKINDFAFATEDVVFGVGTVFDGKSFVIVSTDGGNHWDRSNSVPTTSTFNLKSVALDAVTGKGVAVGDGGKVLRMTLDGQNWSTGTAAAATLNGVALIHDEGGTRTLIVAVGANGTVAFSDNAGVTWVVAPVNGASFPTLRGVALVDSSSKKDGLRGYVVGGHIVGGVGASAEYPVILEMLPDDPSSWVPALFDPRAAAFPAPNPATRPTEFALRGVAAVPTSGGSALAVGSRLMLERTPITAESAATLAEEVQDGQTWWRCVPHVPPGVTGNDSVDPTLAAVSGTAQDTVENQGQGHVHGCDARSESTESPAESGNFGVTGADGCEVKPPPTLTVPERLPCMRVWKPTVGVDGNGNRIPAADISTPGSAVFLDDDVAGQGRRLVVVGKKPTEKARVFLFDPDRLEQRGVTGFGEGLLPGKDNFPGAPPKDTEEWKGVSAYGASTGFVDLSDSPVPLPGIERENNQGTSPVSKGALKAYDSAGDILYFGDSEAGPGTVGAIPKVAAVSLTGRFAPRVWEISPLLDGSTAGSVRTNVALAHLGFDNSHGMLYAVTESNPRRENVLSLPVQADSQQVTLRAYQAGSGSAAGTLTLKWVLPIESECRSTWDLPTFAVARTGDAISLGCAGLAGPHFGNPSLEPNRIVTIRLALTGGRHPAELRPENPGDLAVTSEPIAGKVFGEVNVTLGIDTRSVLAWNQIASGANLWDYETGGWIGSVPYKSISGAGGFSAQDAHPWRGRLYFSCGGRDPKGKVHGACVQFAPTQDVGDEGEPVESPALLVVDTLNVPAQVVASVTEKLPLPKASGLPNRKDPPRSGENKLVAVPPRAPGEWPRLFLNDESGALWVFEDRTAPAGEFASPDPDEATHSDVPEGEASAVTRIGYGSAYGARLWWTGVGTATAVGCQHVVGNQGFGLADPCGTPTLNYDWLMDPEATSGLGAIPHGQHTSAVAGLPGGGARELRFGSVQRAQLDNNTSGQQSSARAVGFFYDGGPSDDVGGTTGEDLHRRRGRDPHQFADAEAQAFCDRAPSSTTSTTTTTTRPLVTPPSLPTTTTSSIPLLPTTTSSTTTTSTTTTTLPPREQCHKSHQDFDAGFEEFEVRFDEFVDRGMREADGQRNINGGCAPPDDPGTAKDESDVDDPTTPQNEGDCFHQFDSGDPRNHPQSPVDDRSVEERAELTSASECLSPGSKDESFVGSKVTCAPGEFGRTQASAALDPLAMIPKEASAALELLSVGGTGSTTHIFRDETRGVVVETEAWTTNVELRVGGTTLRIGEVRSTAQTQAKGTHDSALSWLDVSFVDVVITGPSGATRFACGRAPAGLQIASVDPNKPTPPTLDRNGDHFPDDCDPHDVVNAIGDAFGGKVLATTSARDADPKVTGSPGGAQAMVRRDPIEVMSDQVINRVQDLWELPALELTIFNDALRANRVQVDLAAVYAESKYAIGQRAVNERHAPEPGGVLVDLTNPLGAPLAGAAFALLTDGDGDGRADGQLGECTTDATGECSFGEVDPGAYLVEQRKAPLGYLAEEKARAVFVPEGETEVVEFVNGPDAAAVEVELVDPAGTPLPGGQFALVPDPDTDGAVEPTGTVVATCTTGGAGGCRFERVAVGSWVLHQGRAPRGFKVADDVAFTLKRPGQVAHIRVVNGAAVSGARVQIIEIIDDAVPVSRSQGVPWWAALPKGLAALLLRGWLQALLFALTGALFGTPAYLAHRRRELAVAKHTRTWAPL